MITNTSAFLDSGCSSHFITTDTPTLSTTPNTSTTVQLPDGTTLTSSHTAIIDLHPALPPAAQTAHVLPELQNSLLSVSQLCDSGCTTIFEPDDVTVTYNNTTVLTGQRSPYTNLWHVNLSANQTEPTFHNTDDVPLYINNVIIPNASTKTRIAFYHACCFSPSLSTWIKAIDAGHFATFPGLTSADVRRYPPSSTAMHKGHLDQTRQNQRSTKPTTNDQVSITAPTSTDDEIDHDYEPINPEPHRRSHQIFAVCADITGRISSDQTGRFVTPSSNGNNYLLIVYDYDSNMIFAEPMKSRTGPDHIKAFKTIHAILTSRGLRPQLHRLDNEASVALQQFLTAENIDYQLAPPQVHRRNSAERAIRVFKNHFIAGLCSTNPDFPLHLWDRLLPQALLTLNLLRTSNINPQLSAQALIYGLFDFNRTPLAPPGTQIVIHEKPTVRQTWAAHGCDGWYLGPALKHYRCYRVYVNETNAERISDTLAWIPTNIPMPIPSSIDIAIAAGTDAFNAATHPHPATAIAPTDHQLDLITNLGNMYQNFADQHRPSPTVPPGFNPLPHHTEVPRVPTEPSAPTTSTTPTDPPTPIEPRVPTEHIVPAAPTPTTPTVTTTTSVTYQSATARRQNPIPFK